MTSPQPRIGVFASRARATTATRSGRCPRSTRRPSSSGTPRPSCRTSTGCSSGRVLLRGLPALRRDRPVRARNGGGRRFAAEGGLVLGICNGFQILARPACFPACSAATSRSRSCAATFRSIVERADTPFTSRCAEGDRLTIPVKHGEGCWFADEPSTTSSRRIARSCFATQSRSTVLEMTLRGSSTNAGTSWA